jgi:hypothetical protein
MPEGRKAIGFVVDDNDCGEAISLNAVSARSVGMTTSSIEQYDYLIRP